jgi:hypothetical protein
MFRQIGHAQGTVSTFTECSYYNYLNFAETKHEKDRAKNGKESWWRDWLMGDSMQVCT